jgi:hypothetical protein
VSEEFREFLLILRRALYLVIRWIEKKCGISGGET